MFTFRNERQDPIGHVYKLFVPPAAAGANKVYFDLFNASDRTVEVVSVVPVVSGAVAVVGTLAVDLYLTRTTAVGTGGTAATEEGTALNAATIVKMDPAAPPVRSGISARLAPAGGATAGAVLALNSCFTEETNTASYFRNNLVQVGPAGTDYRVAVPANSGLRVVQGSVASVGNIGFDVLFQVKEA